jgi:hypothetical protein
MGVPRMYKPPTELTEARIERVEEHVRYETSTISRAS